MKILLILFLSISLTGIISCKEATEVAVDDEEIQAYMSDEETLKLAMKKTSRDTRRLAKALESRLSNNLFLALNLILPVLDLLS